MDNNKPLVSVIIATYNSENVLRYALEALRGQTYPSDRMEILIMDGMSTDSTRQIASEYSCRIIDNPKTEQGNAKILGMQNAKGRYVLFVDSDEALDNPTAVERTVEAFEAQPDCHIAVCSGYKRPDNYPYLSGYLSDCGDPFSFFIYNFPKDYRFYADVLRRYYRISDETESYFVFDCDLAGHFPLIEGGCGGIMMDMEYFDKYVPECRTNIAQLYHSYYLMCDHGETRTIYVKNDPLTHYSSDHVSGYLKKLKWRICNNIHFIEKGNEVFSGRENFRKGNRYKKYLFVPYAISIVFPFLHSIPYAISRKNLAYLLHAFFAFYVIIQIVYQYVLKLLHITPSFVAYGSSNKIGDANDK